MDTRSNAAGSTGGFENGGHLNPQKALLPAFEDVETRNLAESLCSRDIIHSNQDVTWESIKGLETAKYLVKEAVVMPIKYPKYFTGLLSPWKGILLYGPPGTGKTMLAKAVATECKTTFFNISASSIVSEWRGDSEKVVRVLFELARHHAPSTIFIDEIDSLISHRGEGLSEPEASSRLKTELLIQMDGLSRSKDLVFVLAATNLPWELDAAMLQRLGQRIFVPLPDPEARRAVFEGLLPPSPSDDQHPFHVLVEKTEGYSGSDIRLVCKEAVMLPLRRVMAVLEQKQQLVPEEGCIMENDEDSILGIINEPVSDFDSDPEEEGVGQPVSDFDSDPEEEGIGQPVSNFDSDPGEVSDFDSDQKEEGVGQGKTSEVAEMKKKKTGSKRKRKRKWKGMGQGKGGKRKQCTVDNYVLEVCKILDEKKIGMVYNAVEFLGTTIFEGLLRQVVEIQLKGGQRTYSGERYKKGGGILWRLLKEQYPLAYNYVTVLQERLKDRYERL